jgi:hypothetical protein
MKLRMKILAFLVLITISGIAKTDTRPVSSNEFAVENITRFELRRIYFMKDRWLDGVGLITLYQRPPHSNQHLQFIRETLGLTPSNYFKELALAVNSGKGAIIKVVSTDDDMINKVTSSDNAIGYIDLDTMVITLDKTTKLLKVVE